MVSGIPIYFVGFMGSGKSTVGRKVAAGLGYNFIDTDLYIVNRFRKSVDEIFLHEGEATFRKREFAIMEEIAGMPQTVIATGGGLPCYNNLMEVLNETGYTVYLQRTPEELAVRLEKCKRTRPAIKALSSDEIFPFVQQELAKRESVYSQAQLSLPVLKIIPDDDEVKLVSFILHHLDSIGEIL